MMIMTGTVSNSLLQMKMIDELRAVVGFVSQQLQ